MDNCDVCQAVFDSIKYDAATRMGPWAWLCSKCFHAYGLGLGTGRGQKYEVVDGKWKKVGG